MKRTLPASTFVRNTTKHLHHSSANKEFALSITLLCAMGRRNHGCGIRGQGNHLPACVSALSRKHSDKACPNLLSVYVAEWRLATQNPPECVSINDGIWDTRIAVFSNSTQRYECVSPAPVIRVLLLTLGVRDQTLAMTATRGCEGASLHHPRAR